MTADLQDPTNVATAKSPNPHLVLASVLLAALVLPLSFTGGAIATPAIGRDLGGTATELTWITNAFMLTFGSLMMTAGALADQYGRKRIFVGGVALFVFFSVALTFAASVAMIDLLRAGQGVGAAAALAGGSAAIAQEFEGHARLRAFSLLGATFGLGLAVGPVMVGWLVEMFGWRSIFMAGAIIGALALVFGAPRMRETRDPDAVGLDWPGVVSFTGLLSLFTFGVIQAPESGWISPLVIGSLSGAVALLAVFIVVERRAARPMLDLGLFRYPRFVGVQLLPIATCYAYVVLLIVLPLRLVGVEGRSEIDAGLLMIALSGPMVVVPWLAANLTRWLSAGVVAGVGLVIAAIGLLWLGAVPAGANLALVPPILVIGFGAGLPWGLMDGLSVTVVPKERAGMATGVFNTTKVAGEGVALAIVSAALAGLTASNLRSAGAADRVGEIAQRVATGDLPHAAALAPAFDRAALIQSYLGAFQQLTWGLSAITLVSAIAAFTLLGRVKGEP
ncbi:MFS transporter (plasmid) [Brevundimonas staleyi]|uniref:MFS transporter n=1 Tax=Brevundimonas staleyi TaxID=74326 RepID=A0ABW0FMJ6_9CAUL